MNTEAMFSSKTDEWATPPAFFLELDKEFHFDLDPCASAENHKCKKYFTIKENGLLQSWGGIAFSAIRPMAEKSGNGLKRLFRRINNSGMWSSCFYRPGLIRSGFTNTYITRQKSASFAAG